MNSYPYPFTIGTPTVGTSSVQVAPQNLTRDSLFVYNPNLLASLWVSPGDISAAVNGAGSIQIPPGTGSLFRGWTAAMNAIATLAGQKITIHNNLDGVGFVPSGSSGGGGGGVSAVGLAAPLDVFIVTGSPITSAGTLTLAFNTQVKNIVWAGPASGVDATPGFRSLVVADLPVVDVPHGGTGLATLTNHGVLIGQGASNVVALAAAVVGSLLAGGGVAADPAFTSTPVLGIAGTTAGAIGISGVTSGVVTLRTAAVAGTWSFTLPTTGGTPNAFLQTDGSGVTTWAAPTAVLSVGGTTIGGGTTTRVLFDNAGILGEYGVTGTGNVVMSTTQGLTGTSPSALFQITGDANARLRVGINSSDGASIAFGDGTAVRDTFIERKGAANIRHGGPDAAAPVAQTISVQNVVAGTSDTAGATLIFTASQSTGTGAAGTIAFQTASAAAVSASTQNALATVVTIGASSNLGSSTTTALTVAPTWNTSGAPTAFIVNPTNTASSTSSLLADFQASSTSVTKLHLTGGITSTSGATNAAIGYSMANSNAGNAAASGLSLFNNSSSQLLLQNLSTGWGGSFAGVSQSGLVRIVAIGALVIGTGFGSSASVVICTNSNAIGTFSTTAFSLASAIQLNWNSDAFITRKAAASIQFGAADAASPVAQSLSAQNVVAGTSNTAGANWTHNGSIGTGTGAGGQIILRTAPAGSTGSTQNALATGLTITAPAVNMQPSVIIGNQALATTATDGFLYICSGAGTPTGVPTTFTGRVALYYDTTNHQFWIYDGAWLQPKTPAGAALVTWQ